MQSQNNALGFQLALQQRHAAFDHVVQRASLKLRFAARQEFAYALDDAPGVCRLFAQPLQGAQQHRIGVGLALQRVEHAGVVTADGAEGLVQLVRQRGGHFAQHGQPRMVGHGVDLVALACLGVFAGSDVEDGAHPTDVAVARIDQRRLVNHHVQQLAVAVLPARLVATARCRTGHVAVVALHRLFGFVGGPVGHRRQLAQQLVGAETHHVGERAVDVNQAAFEVAGAQAHGERVFHRAAPGGFGAPRQLGARHVAHLAAQHPGDAADQQHKARHHRHGEAAVPRRNAVAGDEFEFRVHKDGRHADAPRLAVGQRLAFSGGRCDLAQAADDAHVVFAGQPPGHVLTQHFSR